MAWQERRRLILADKIVWGEPSATAVGGVGGFAGTHSFSVDALANGSAWQGDKVRLTTIYSEYLAFLFWRTGTAPTAGSTVDLYFAWATDNGAGTAIGWPRGVTGTDGSFTAAYRTQIGNPLPLIVDAAADTIIPAPARLVIPAGEWVSPIVYNGTGQANANFATDADNPSGLYLIPFVREWVEI